MPMKSEERYGYRVKSLLVTIINLVTASPKLAVMLVLKTTTPKKFRKESLKLLKQLPDWNCFSQSVVYRGEIYLNYLASWGAEINLEFPTHTICGRMLHLDSFSGERTVYYVPLNLIDRLKKLPGINLGEHQISILLKMANCLDPYTERHTYNEIINNPAMQTLINNVVRWKKHPIDQDLLADLFQQKPVLLWICLAAADIQLRTYCTEAVLPTTVYNFILPSKLCDAYDDFISIIRTLTFVNSESLFDEGPILLTNHFEMSKYCPGRLVVAEGSYTAAKPFLAGINEDDRLRKCGVASRYGSAGTPIFISTDYFNSPYALEITLASQSCPLTDNSEFALRSAMAKLLTSRHAENVIQSLAAHISSPYAYRHNRADVFRKILLHEMLQCWFGSRPDLLERMELTVIKLYQKHQSFRAILRQKIEEAAQLLTHPEQYAELLADRPKTFQESTALLENKYVGLRYTPTKGPNKQDTLVLFTPDSFSGFTGLDHVYHSAVLARCAELGFSCERDRVISFSDGSQRLIALNISTPTSPKQ